MKRSYSPGSLRGRWRAGMAGLLAGAAMAFGGDGSTITWWVAADSHVGHHTEEVKGERLALVINDVNQVGSARFAVMLGDLMDDNTAYVPEFLRLMNQLDMPWSYVLGNHDFDRRTRKPLLPPLYFARTVHGIRCIFLSDEVSGFSDRDLVMSHEQEQWFLEELEAHRDKPVFLFTHQPHWECEFWERLKDHLKAYRIEAWFSGHKHRWDIRPDPGHGFVQVNMHSIGGAREDYLSCYVDFTPMKGEVRVTVRFRNHETAEWIEVDGIENLTFTVALGAR